MTTLLVNDGWVNEDAPDILLGEWTNQADMVDEGDEILVEEGVVANTLGGDDIITGTGVTRGSIDNFGKIETENGDDTIKGTSGIFSSIVNTNGKIETGNGNDIIEGTSTNGTGIFNGFSSMIETGEGEDIIKGTSTNSTGIFNGFSGMIETGNGNDIIEGTSTNSRGIFNRSMIKTGNGNDIITGTGGNIGIFNFDTIETGNGKDTVDALTGGFDGGGTINLGRGKDLIQGFGEQSVFGGQGMDTAELGIDYDVDLLSLGSSFDIKIGEMEFTDVETFVFNDETFSLQDLQGEVV